MCIVDERFIPEQAYKPGGRKCIQVNRNYCIRRLKQTMKKETEVEFQVSCFPFLKNQFYPILEKWFFNKSR
jgi:hypothetical protein